MTELRRLRDLDGELGAAFRAADVDVPRPESKAALLAAMGVGAGLATAAGTANAAAAKLAAGKVVASAAGGSAGAAGSAAAAGGAGMGAAGATLGGAGATAAKASLVAVVSKWVVGSAIVVAAASATTYAARQSSPTDVPPVVTAPVVVPAPVESHAQRPVSLPPPPPSPTQDREPDPIAALPAHTVLAPTLAPTPLTISPPISVDALPSAPAGANGGTGTGTSTGTSTSTGTGTSTGIGTSTGTNVGAGGTGATGIHTPAPPARATVVAEEIAELDRARRQLAGGRPNEALATLQRYRARFPGGVLGEESRVIEIEALAAAGNIGRARTLGAAFLAERPGSPLAARVKRVTGDP